MNTPSGPLTNGSLHADWKVTKTANGVTVTSKNYPGLEASGSTVGVALSKAEHQLVKEYANNTLFARRKVTSR